MAQVLDPQAAGASTELGRVTHWIDGARVEDVLIRPGTWPARRLSKQVAT
jgi:hypothetical protein